jgi:hypothetical protein
MASDDFFFSLTEIILEDGTQYVLEFGFYFLLDLNSFIFNNRN